MMGKVGLITFFEHNYGSILQCFATKTFIESLNYKCDILFKCYPNRLFRKISTKLRLVVKSLFYAEFRREYNRRAKVHVSNSQNPRLGTNRLFDVFIRQYFHPVEFHNNKVCKRRYDYFMTGSDQIWNSSYLFEAFGFLTFASRQKRIALAPSFGTSEIPKYNQKLLKRALSGFDYISVREETGVEIVKKYSDAKVCRIADPTFIYSADEWRNFAKEVKLLQKKYIFVHFLNEPNQIALDSLNWLSELLDLDIIVIGYNYEVLKNVKRLVYMDGGPWEYISYIDNAEYVLTDSFHSTLFSINFNKRFFTFHRQYSSSKQTSRITDLLKRFDMENRLIENVDILKRIYLNNQPENSRVILKKERSVIRDYIQKSISGQIPQCFTSENNG